MSKSSSPNPRANRSDHPAVLWAGRSRPGAQSNLRKINGMQRPFKQGDVQTAEQLREQDVATAVAMQVTKENPDDLYAQVTKFFTLFRIPAARGRERSVGNETTNKYFDCGKAFMIALDELNMRPRNLHELSARQLIRCVQKWETDGMSASTLQNRYACLKRFLKWLGKGKGLGTLKSVLRDPTRGVRQYSATTPKTWESAGVNIEEQIQAIEMDCPVTAMHLRLECAFGLRSKEALCLRPVESDKGTHLLLNRGTKGGKGRSVPITSSEQRDLLERSKAMIDKRTGFIGRHGNNLDKAVYHYYYILRKHGVTRKANGVTAHGLRHSYANNRYRDMTGMESPVNGGSRIEREQELTARQDLSRELGHERIEITSAYIGSFKHIDQTANKNRAALIAEVEQPAVKACIQAIRAELAAQGRTATFYALDDAAEGMRLPKAAPLHISVQIEGEGADDVDGDTWTAQLVATGRAISQLTPFLTQTIGRKVYVVDNRVEPSSTTRLELFL